MPEIETSRVIPGPGFMKGMNEAYDEYIIAINADYGYFFDVPSNGIPIEVLESKSRFLSNLMVAGSGTHLVITGGSTPTISPSPWFELESAHSYTDDYFFKQKLIEQSMEAIDVLEQKVEELEERVAYLEAASPEEKVIVLRELTRDEAKTEILELFSRQQALYYSDIAEQLRLDLELVVDICNELESAGEVHVIDEAV